MSQIAVTTFFTDAAINLCVSSFASLHNLLLLTYHIQKILKILKKSEQKLHRTYLLSITTISMILLLNMYVLLFNMSVVLNVSIANCNTRASIGLIMIFLSKIGLYVLLFERLFVIFRNSQFAFSKTKIILTRVIICWFTITCIFPLIFEKNGKIYSDGNCKTNVKLYLKAIFILVDLGISVWIMVLFSRRLWLLSLNTFSNSDDSSVMSGSSQYTHTHITKPRSNSVASQKQEKKYIRKMNKQLLRVMTKTNLLTLIAIITNEMNVVILSFAPSTVWPMIDSMVNCWCVLLMFKSHEKIFDCMCKYASKTISDQCLIFCACPCCVQLDKQDDEIIEDIITGNHNGNGNDHDNSDTNGTPVALKTNVIDNNSSVENIKTVEIEAVASISPSGINDNKQSGQMKLEIDNMNDINFKFGMKHDLDEQIVEIAHMHDYQHSTHL